MNYNIDSIITIKNIGSYKTMRLSEDTKQKIINLYKELNHTNDIPRLEFDLPLKFTKIERKTSSIDIIKGELNKLADKTFDKIKQMIINEIENEENKEIFLKNLTNMIWYVSSNNSFYANLYAKLFNELSKKYSTMLNYFYDNDEYIKYRESFKVVRSIMSTSDMELEFEINKENDKRKSVTKFIVCCCIFNVEYINVIFDIISNELIKNDIICDEIYDHLQIICNPFLASTLNKLKINDKMIKEYINDLINNEKTNKKTKFKLMDILNNLDEF
uniref:MIF4G domain-containing protein n=1 Tax=viral metagenome TaxID=1070528 RepID=A0A6C0H5C7_9ZZZZ